MSLKKALVVARWEFVEKVRTKTFIISLILMPVFIIVVSVVPSLLINKPSSTTINVGIIDKTGEIAPILDVNLLGKYKLPDGRPNYNVVVIPPGDSARTEANRMVLSNRLSSYIVVDTNIMSSRKFEYVSENVSNFKDISRLQSAVKDILVTNELQRNGIKPSIVKEVTRPVDLETVRLSKEGKEEKTQAGSGFILGYIFIIILAFFVVTSGQLLVRSVVEEKSNRIVEVLLSSMTADEIMTGKILGLSLLGLTQLAVWGAIAISFAGQLAAFITVPGSIWWEGVFFVLGFLFYSSIFVMAGAPVTTEQEAQQATTYVSMLLFLPIVLATMVAQNPSASYIKILSLIPLLTPTMMAFRIPIQTPDLWELIAGTLILIGSTYFCMIAAGRIFKIGILVYGKRPSLNDLVRWAMKKG
ncbi:MAG: ABC transporter permease [Bacteroidetes bacterium]|nr:ABC transporter permease [Bacteroidota bacterium]